MRKIAYQNAAELYNMPTTPPPPLN
jgi:hypothetical protein